MIVWEYGPNAISDWSKKTDAIDDYNIDLGNEFCTAFENTRTIYNATCPVITGDTCPLLN